MKTRKYLITRLPETKVKPKSGLRVCSFFAGIGGFDLGLERAGIKPVYHCEINPFCQSVLRSHWPKVPLVSDIATAIVEDIPDADIWCGGFPCQDVSVARGWLGRDGLKGNNTGLFYPFIRLVAARRPAVVVLENVAGLLNSHDGRDFAVVLSTLNSIGYGVSWRILNTRYFGAPQSRPRVYVCAWLGSANKAVRVLYEGGTTRKPESPRLGFLRESQCRATGAYVPEVAFCLAATSGRHTGTDWSRSYVAYHSDVRRLTPNECERIQGFPTNWTAPIEDLHLASDAMDSQRYHAIGNAVSVPVVEWVANRIVNEFKGKDTELPRTTLPSEGIERYGSYVREFVSSKATVLDLPCVSDFDKIQPIKWSAGGLVIDGTCVTAPVSSAPSNPHPSRLVDILDEKRPDPRYFLTPNAAKGIKRRVASQGRKLFKPLDSALARLQEKVQA